MKQFIFIISVSVIVLSGCVSPAHIFTVVPAENEIRWNNGVGLLDKTDHDVSVVAGFEENRNDMLCFNVTISNKSEKEILVDPKEFECIASSSINQDTLQQSMIGSLHYAADPEVHIRQIDIQLSQENASYQSAQTTEAIGLLGNIVLDVASIGKSESEEQQKEKEQQREDARIRSIDRDNEHSARIESLNQEKTFWQSQTLRKTILPSGQTIGGKVLFYHQEKEKFLRLRFPFHQACINMRFIQKIVRR